MKMFYLAPFGSPVLKPDLKHTEIITVSFLCHARKQIQEISGLFAILEAPNRELTSDRLAVEEHGNEPPDVASPTSSYLDILATSIHSEEPDFDVPFGYFH